MYLQFLTIAAGIFLLTDLMFYLGIRPFLAKWKKKAKNIFLLTYWAFTFFSLVLLSVAVYHYYIQLSPPKFARIYLTGFVFIVFLSKITAITLFLINGSWNLVKALYRRIRGNTSTFSYQPSRKEFLRKAGLIGFALPFLSLNYGMLFGAFNFKVRKVKLSFPNLPPSFQGFKIVQISDIHSGSFISKDPLERAVQLVLNQEPDLILFTGDLVNEIAEEAEVFIDVLKKLQAPMGVYAILGNHDYGDYFYPKDDLAAKQHNKEKMKEIYQKLGWKLLLNEHVILQKDGGKIGLIGCENWGKSERFPKYGDIQKARANMERCPMNILMTHDPSHWDEEVLPNFKDIDLTLSGHTHGFQMGVELSGYKWSPAQYLYKQWAGLYRENTNFIYVNRGLGFTGYPGRLGISPEITSLELSQSIA